jgi:signal transduction histidine kinase/DNA-binding response OmpR family regulator/streptogramin lyase
MYDGNSFTHYTSKEGLISDEILSIKEDGYGNIWLTTMEGIMKFQRNSFTYYTQLEDIGKGKVTSIAEDRKGNIWFGFLTGGLIKYDGKSYEIIKEGEGLNKIPVRSMLGDKYGNIWYTNDKNTALQKYDGESVTTYENKGIWNSVYGECINYDNEGNIWVGTWGEGLKKFDGESFTNFLGITYLPDVYITSVLQDHNEDIWYGTITYGLFRYNGECITQYTVNEGLSGMSVTALFEDKSGNLWIGIQDGGVNKFDGQSFEYFTEEEGLISNNVSSIIGDNKRNIWVGTEKGLSLLSPLGDWNYSIISFGTEDDLKNINFNNHSVCLDSRNRLWWGTGNIVTMLDLNTFEINTKLPVIQLNNIHLNQQYIDFRAFLPGIKKAAQSPSDTSTRMNMRGLKFTDVAPFCNYPLNLKLPHYLNNVTFNFSAIDWTATQGIRYQYMLGGLDEHWSPLSLENKADYRNIPSGKYMFRVKAKSTSNIWSEIFEYPFTVHPPWWFRWWAFTFYAVVVVLLARYYIRFIISRERIKADVQIKQVEVEKMQELDHMKSRFFANISHEFRTPLTLIIGPIEDLFKRKPERAELTWDIMGIMHRNAKRLQKLINQLLDLSRLETGEIKLQVSEGSLEEFLRTIILSFLSLAESKKIRYEYVLPGTSEQHYFDCDKLEKITTNLISNALKFTPEEGSVIVSLQYSGEKNVAPGQYAELSVKDTGPGIPEHEQEKIFNRFYQVSSSDTRDQEGSGIGLALARELVELYRGELHVESEPGMGSTFTVRLPVSKEQFREEEMVTVSGKPAESKLSHEPEILEREAAAPGIRKETVKEKDKDLPIVLIVEDNADLRKYISGNLSGRYQILEAENGREGLDKAIENIPDLVISDLMMPEMDGVEMCERLKKDTRTSHIPLVMLTAKADRESKLESLETGADDYIIKPFDAEELQVRVKNLIEQRKRLREKFSKLFLGQETGAEPESFRDQFIKKIIDAMDQHYSEFDFSVKEMGRELYMSRAQFFRKVHALTGTTPNELLRLYRIRKAASLIESGQDNITAIMYGVGFQSTSHFAKSFRKYYGKNPSEYRDSLT